MPDTPPAGLRRHVRHVTHEPPDDVVSGTRWRGALVLGPRAPEMSLVARSEGVEQAVTWGLASPRLRRRFPRGSNSDTARFEVELPTARSAVDLVARTPAGLEQVVARFEPATESDPAETVTLAAVPPAERDPDWIRRSLLVLVEGRRRPRVALEHLAALHDLLDEGAFGALWAEVDARLAPLALTVSGYHPSLGSAAPEVFFAELADLVTRLQAFGHPLFLLSGTLLGAVREGRPLAHDYDADLGVLLPGRTPEEVVDQLWALKDALHEAGLLDEDYEHERRHHLRVSMASGTPVDLFPAWVAPEGEEERLHVWPWTAGALDAGALLPLGHLDLAGSALPVPHDVDAVLACNYGAGWRTFDPAFTFDWATARDQHADYIRASTQRWDAASG